MTHAADFRSLHVDPALLLLPNAWDGTGARILEIAGARAIATTSAGISWARGARDGGKLDRDRMIQTLTEIVATVSVPVSADIEDGFGPAPTHVAETVRLVLAAGAVGINIEDGARTPADTAERIAAARAVSTELFINARTDVFLGGDGSVADRIAETLRRAAIYRAAGADGIFVPGVTDAETIAALAAGIDGPLNVMVGADTPEPGELARLGVARLSSGSALAQSAYAGLRRDAEGFLSAGTAPRNQLAYGELNAMIAL
ncbi:isocitrate lyase/phosphoenolpyruvate mutase family protein [Mycetocola tolaasinivorans]|uniref:Isocitrate lyase/phosphoenolpyruvate mutase family protein n=1 Tax=Mycetocola tolaasinivorans TaxID=76635 RepID=A0A3L7A6Q6_9MICO|nr:isocitrate lyase/phosphoenolpyruvate mutase family protein [Mycetocola tolaasinivorans]RLP75568.1 isocitrate lyase/phosphoenolpyruvate mutase family protein [Mycetocola tolaasinivorans]